MYIVGVSRLFFIVWRMVRPWLDAHTASKIGFLTSEDANATLCDVIDASQLPTCYGGMLAAPWDDGGGDDSPPTTPRGSASLAGDAGGAAAVAGAAAAPSGADRSAAVLAVAASTPTRDASPMHRLRAGGAPGSRPGSIDWGGAAHAQALTAALSHPLPPHGHSRGHSRSASADFAARSRAGTPTHGIGGGIGGGHHRRMASDDISVASWASAMSLDDSDTEFFDAVDLYVEARLAEVEDAAAAAGAGSGGAAASKDAAGAASGGMGLLGLPARRGAARRMSFELGGTAPGATGAPLARSSTARGAAASALQPIPEQRVIAEVRGRLNRVRLLLDSTNVLTCIAGIVLIAYGDDPFQPQTLKVFGGVIMTVSLLSIIAGLAVSISAVTVFWWVRDCIFGPRAPAVEGEEEEEGEQAV
jgi:hypothetical protein